MESFRWDEHFITGLTDVDRQHHHLVGNSLPSLRRPLISIPVPIRCASASSVKRRASASNRGR